MSPLHHAALLRGPPPRTGEDLFAAAASRLAGLAGALLGWRVDEFWRSTPAELAAVLGAMMPDEVCASSDDLARLREMFPDDLPPVTPDLIRGPSSFPTSPEEGGCRIKPVMTIGEKSHG